MSLLDTSELNHILLLSVGGWFGCCRRFWCRSLCCSKKQGQLEMFVLSHQVWLPEHHTELNAPLDAAGASVFGWISGWGTTFSIPCLIQSIILSHTNTHRWKHPHAGRLSSVALTGTFITPGLRRLVVRLVLSLWFHLHSTHLRLCSWNKPTCYWSSDLSLWSFVWNSYSDLRFSPGVTGVTGAAGSAGAAGAAGVGAVGCTWGGTKTQGHIMDAGGTEAVTRTEVFSWKIRTFLWTQQLTKLEVFLRESGDFLLLFISLLQLTGVDVASVQHECHELFTMMSL